MSLIFILVFIDYLLSCTCVQPQHLSNSLSLRLCSRLSLSHFSPSIIIRLVVWCVVCKFCVLICLLIYTSHSHTTLLWQGQPLWMQQHQPLPPMPWHSTTMYATCSHRDADGTRRWGGQMQVSKYSCPSCWWPLHHRSTPCQHDNNSPPISMSTPPMTMILPGHSGE